MELLKAGVLTVSEVRALRGLGAVQPVEEPVEELVDEGTNQEIEETE
jgi:hypothetical protein